MSTRTLFASVELGGQIVPLAECSIVERLHRVTEGTIEVALPAGTVGGAAGGEATLVLEVDGAPVRRISLIVGEGAFDRSEGGTHRYAYRLYSPYWSLRHTRNTRKFRNQSAKDIISTVLGEAGIGHSWQLTRDPPVRKYCVQYRESAFDFVNRLLEFEGIHYQCLDDGSLLLTDHSETAGVVDGPSSEFELLENEGALEGDVGVHEIGAGRRVASGTITVNDYNWKTPAVDLLQTASGDDGELEIYDYPAGFRKPGDGAAIAARRLEAHRCRTSFVAGRSNVPFFQPGRRFTYRGLNAGEYLFVQVAHVVRNEAYFDDGDDTTTYRNEFEAIPVGVPFRPMWETPRPVVSGAHTAMVRGPEGEEIHTDKYGRFRAQFHWDRDATGSDEDSRWLRKVQESGTGANLARVGWEMSVAYIDGDPDRPIGLARDINGQMPPSYGQPADMTIMTIKTPTYPSNGGYNEIRFDDRAGDQLMHIHAERRLLGEVRNDRTEDIRRDETHRIDGLLTRDIIRNQKLEVVRDRTTLVRKNRDNLVEGNRSDVVGGDDTLRSSESISVSVEGNDLETVGSTRFTMSGSIAPPDIASTALGLAGVPGGGGGIAGALGGGGGIAGALGGGGIAGALGGGGGIAGALGGGGGIAGALGGGGGISGLLGGGGGLGGALGGGGGLGGALGGGGGLGGLAGASGFGGFAGLGGSLSKLAQGNIGRAAETSFTRTVGGAKIAASADQIIHEGGEALIDLVGGAKITVAGGEVSNKVGGPNVHLVGGAEFRRCNEDMGIGAETSAVLVGGLAAVESEDKIEVHADRVTFTAAASFRLVVGEDLAIEMTRTKIAFRGPMYVTADDKVAVKAPTEDDLTAKGEEAAE